jgi:hypothetical protein
VPKLELLVAIAHGYRHIWLGSAKKPWAKPGKAALAVKSLSQTVWFTSQIERGLRVLSKGFLQQHRGQALSSMFGRHIDMAQDSYTKAVTDTEMACRQPIFGPDKVVLCLERGQIMAGAVPNLPKPDGTFVGKKLQQILLVG